jgi:hypothetical protein
MDKFSSIESLKHAVANVRRYCNEKAKPLPTLKFEGTVKLHGTNAGVRRTASGKLQPQSRERIIDIGSDNNGFAFFVESRKAAIEALYAGFPADADVTLFGEWCGGNIQKGVALNALEKHWVLFKVMVDGKYVPLPRDLHDNANGVWNVYQIPTYDIVIDFTNPSPASDIIADLTYKVEETCPWAIFRGVEKNGDEPLVGEGIVWSCTELDEDLGIWFKTKGLLHKGNDKTKTPKIKIENERLADIKAVVDEVLPQWRLEQGISEIKQMGLPLLPESTGEYLKWIAKDVLKEEMDTIVEGGFEWKSIQGQVMQTARQFWLTEINKVE